MFCKKCGKYVQPNEKVCPYCGEEIIKNTLGTITKKEIAEKCPDISVVTIQRTLAELLTAEKILKIGGGRYTKYTWNNER